MNSRYHQHQLANGLKVLLVPIKGVASVTTLVLGNTGSRYEQPAEYGLAHFFEHMVFKGTKRYPTAKILSETVDSLGAEFNAFTSKEYTVYYMKTASRHLETALDLLSDMLLQPNLLQEDIDREKNVIVEEINMYHDTPMRHVATLFERLMYQGSGLEHDIAGTKESVRGVKAAGFRQFLAKWYGLENLLLVLAGDAKVVESDQTMKLVEELFSKSDGGGREGGQNSLEWLKQHEVKRIYGKERLLIDRRNTEQAHISLGWQGVDRLDSRRHALNLLATVIGGNMSSRLFSELREKRALCYYVRSEMDLFHDGGSFGASAGVDAKRINEALEVTIDIFRQTASGGSAITKAELERAREHEIGSLILSLEDSGRVGQFYGLRQLLTGRVRTPEQLIADLKAVTLDQVNQVAREIIKDDGLRLAVIGPFTKSKLQCFVNQK